MDNPKKVLIIQLKRAGDVIVTTPVLAALHQALPDAQIDFLIDKPFASLLENNPNVNNVHIFDRSAVWATWKKLRSASYDWILDFQSSPRSIMAGIYSGAPMRAGFQVTFWGKFFHRSIRRPGQSISVTEGKMNVVRALLPKSPAAGERRVYLTATEREWAANIIGKGRGAKGSIGMIPTSRRPSRCWPSESFVRLAQLLISQGRSVWWFWGPGEEEMVSAIQQQVPESRMIPRTSLREMAALLEQCESVVTVNNGPMHLAVAVGTPTLTLYGSTDPTAWSPGNPRHQVIQVSGLSCLGCGLSECPFGHECMTGITPEMMMAKIESFSQTLAEQAR